MSNQFYSDVALAKGAATQRWAALAKLDVDVDSVATWDPKLPRDKRVMVPIDVQAFVVPTTTPESTIAFAGARTDPDPFSQPASRNPGVHLHWAMPDALLRARHVDGATSITLPRLPDRWVVVRTLLPVDGRLVHATGWVVDAVKGSVTPLVGYAGTTADPPAGTARYDQLDGASGGTLLWSATYDGAINRFALHDPLTDLAALTPIAPKGFHANRACYTVAGWWTDSTHDPLAAALHRTQLNDVLATLGWHISPESPDDADQPFDPLLLALRDATVLDSPTDTTPTYQVSQYSKQRTRYSDTSPVVATPVEKISAHYLGIRTTRYHSLLHGSVLGVPIGSSISTADDRPLGDSISTALGADLDDVTAALAAPTFGLADDQRVAAERLMAAFTSGLLSRIATPDGIRDIEEREHADGFWSFAGKALPNARPDRLRGDDALALGPTAVGRKGRGALAGPGRTKGGDAADLPFESRVSWKESYIQVRSGSKAQRAAPKQRSAPPAADAPSTGARTVEKPAPRLLRPAPPLVGVRGLKPHARHHGDGLFDPEGLRCRWPGECKPDVLDLVDPAKILPTLGTGAIPAEVLTVVREAAIYDPYSGSWMAKAGAPDSATVPARELRIKAEHIRLFGETVTYDGSGAAGVLAKLGTAQAANASTWDNVGFERNQLGMKVAEQLAEHAVIGGAPPSPVAVTTWRQPWVPLALEWRVRAIGDDTLDGWNLLDLDLERADAPTPTPTIDREVTGRSPISTSIAGSLTQAMTNWLVAEQARDTATPSQSQIDDDDEAALARLRDLIAPLDLVSASLDGIREQLLGIEYAGGMVVREPAADGGKPLPTASGLPVPLFGGEFEVLELRAVDAFGRVLDIPVGEMRTTRLLEIDARPATIRVRPRVQHGARWLFRLVDPGHSGDPAAAPEAYVDQVAGDDSITPIAGYLLPDHMDESLEVFDRFGRPIGELFHDAVSEAVVWEPAPARAVAPDAGPMTGIPGEFGAHAQHAGLLAAGVLRADVNDRHGDQPATRSALSSMLRAIDSTLWSIDTFQSIGSPTIAGLVGRPVAIVTATLRLELPDDADELHITEAGGIDARRAAFAGMDRLRFPVRLGDLGRSDDALLGFYVNDDYTRFHVVDKVVAAQARDSGRHHGHLGLLGSVTVPDPDPIDHSFIEEEDTLLVAPGEILRLTLLMLPAGKVHLTSGIVPRKSLSLADDWTRGLARLVPSLRVGPVLVDPAEIRMPKVASLGENQNFIRRTGPLTWREDPIVAATSAAFLPRIPHESQEGWIRVAPTEGEPS